MKAMRKKSMQNKAAVMLQKNIRMWMCKKRYNVLLAEKIIKEDEELYEKERRRVEESLRLMNGTRADDFATSAYMEYSTNKSTFEVESYTKSIMEPSSISDLKIMTPSKQIQDSMISPGDESKLETTQQKPDEVNFSVTGISFRQSSEYENSSIWTSSVKKSTYTKEGFFTSRFSAQPNQKALEHESSYEASLKKPENRPIQSSRPSARMLPFSPKSQRLAKPCMYEFDIYLRAAVEIQRAVRGFLYRRKHGWFQDMKKNAIKIQREYRRHQKARDNAVKNALKEANKLQKIIGAALTEFQSKYEMLEKYAVKAKHRELAGIIYAKAMTNVQQLYLGTESSREPFKNISGNLTNIIPPIELPNKMTRQQEEIEDLRRKLIDLKADYKSLETEKRQEEIRLKNTIAKLQKRDRENFKIYFNGIKGFKTQLQSVSTEKKKKREEQDEFA